MTLDEARAELHKVNRLLDRIKAMPESYQLSLALRGLSAGFAIAAERAEDTLLAKQSRQRVAQMFPSLVGAEE